MSEKLTYKFFIKKYLPLISTLCNKEITEDELVSLEENKNLFSAFKDIPYNNIYKFIIGYELLKTNEFNDYIKSLHQLNANPVYVSCEYTRECGLYLLDSIFNFNYNVKFEQVTGGVIGFITQNIENALLLDFDIDELGNKIIEISVSGLKWPTRSCLCKREEF